MKLNSKLYNERRHAKRRCLERYGIELNREKYNEICDIIRSGKSTPVKRTSNRTTTHIINYQGKTMRVVYDSQRHQIVTFLPYDNHIA